MDISFEGVGFCKFVEKKSMERNKAGYDKELYDTAIKSWEMRAGIREERERCKRFTYGDQWSDRLELDGYSCREDEALLRDGNLPLKNNLIRRLVRNVLGVYRNRWRVPQLVARDESERGESEAMSRLIAYNADINSLEELYARSMEEFLIGGMVVHKKWYGLQNGVLDCWTDYVQPDSFFINTDACDYRNRDVTLVGEIHMLDFGAVCAAFAKSEQDIRCLEEIYQQGSSDGRCRVLEVWRRSYTPRYHCHSLREGRVFKIDRADWQPDGLPGVRSQLIYDEEWHYTFLGPQGEVLASGISPYAHGKHPYVFKAYPLVDGEIHSFVSDVIDQQKYANRLITMYDWILRSSAKGVLLFPEGALPAGTDINDIASEWSRFNGVIVYRPRQGVPIPQQVSANSTNIGITELLNIQLRMMEDISGVSGVLQGRLDNASMSGTLLSKQTENSMNALADLIRSFESFVEEAAFKDVSNINQYYAPEKIRRIAGASLTLMAGGHRSDLFDCTQKDFHIRV